MKFLKQFTDFEKAFLYALDLKNKGQKYSAFLTVIPEYELGDEPDEPQGCVVFYTE